MSLSSFLHTVKWFHLFLSNTNAQLNIKSVLFQTIQSSISTLFALSLNIKQFYLPHRYDPFRCYHSWPKWTWEWWQWRVTPHPHKLQYYWSFTIRFFSVISRTLFGGGESYQSAEMQSVIFTAPADWATITSDLSGPGCKGNEEVVNY